MTDPAAAIDAFNTLTPWHLAAFTFIILVIARPEWLAAVWRRLTGSTPPKLNGNTSQRMDSHEKLCEERYTEIKEKFETVFEKLDTIHTRLWSLVAPKYRD